MRYLTIGEIVVLHRWILDTTGGLAGVRDLAALESAVAQPRASFGGVDLHASAIEKAAALCFSIVQNHPFLDGNKRVGHATMETFLVLNGLEIEAPVEEQERTILDVAAGRLDRPHLAAWVADHVRPIP
jgi:death-on-curing protein